MNVVIFVECAMTDEQKTTKEGACSGRFLSMKLHKKSTPLLLDFPRCDSDKKCLRLQASSRYEAARRSIEKGVNVQQQRSN